MDTQHTSRKERDTGFPEPFNDDRNTTLPYPGADLSGNAVISMDSLMGDPFAKTSRRHRLSKHKRAVSYGKIQHPHTQQSSAAGSKVSVIDTNLSNSVYASDANNATHHATATSSAAGPALETPTSAAPSSVRASGEDTDAFSFKNHDEETPPSSPEMGSPRKSGLFRRLRGLSRG